MHDEFADSGNVLVQAGLARPKRRRRIALLASAAVIAAAVVATTVVVRQDLLASIDLTELDPSA